MAPSCAAPDADLGRRHAAEISASAAPLKAKGPRSAFAGVSLAELQPGNSSKPGLIGSGRGVQWKLVESR